MSWCGKFGQCLIDMVVSGGVWKVKWLIVDTYKKSFLMDMGAFQW